jgi:hypothetical protein
MKKTILLSLIFALIIGGCIKEKKSPIEGAWQMVYASWSSRDVTFPAQVKGGQIKTWNDGYYTFVGHLELDTLAMDNYGAGTYKLDGGGFQTKRLYARTKTNINTSERFLWEIRNDTLIQRQPADENWKLPEKFTTEKYIRLK